MSSTIIPTLRYRDAPRMIDWLCKAFGFERNAVYEDGKGGIAHAQLTLGPGMIMLGSYRDDAPIPSKQTTADVGTLEGNYLVVPDADAVYRQVKASGAEIIREIQDEEYGGRGFTARDPEGHAWSIGTYDPWHHT
jgi:uncharacterized glyoxalase superfamily protein PhnB